MEGQSSKGGSAGRDFMSDDPPMESSILQSADLEMMKLVEVAGQSRHQSEGQGVSLRDESPEGMNSTNYFPVSQTVMDAVFSNPIILDTIFKFHASPKTHRLVSKCWNDAVLSGKPHLTLKPQSIPCGENREEFETIVDTLDPRLVKRVEEYLGREGSLQSGQKLVYICEKLGPNIQELVVGVYLHIVPILYQILGSDSTPNIKSLFILIHTEGESSLNEIVPVVPIKSQLKAIRFYFSPPEEDWIRSFAMISPFFRSLLTAAPKLKKLEIKSFFCPTLESNKELKYFRLYSTSKNLPALVKANDGSSMQYLNLTNLPQILGVVKDSLETLKLGMFWRSAGRDFNPCQIPTMLKLKVFTNGSNGGDDEARGINCNLRDLWKDRMPSLTQLKIAFHLEGPRQRKKILRSIINFQNEGIKRLGLIGLNLNSTQDVDPLKELKKPFPFLVRLDLFLEEGTDHDEVDFNYSAEMGTVLKSCSTLGLQHLRIKTEFSCTMSYMVKALWGCREELFPGLKVLEMINSNEFSRYIRDDYEMEDQVSFQEILMRSKEMQSFIFEGYLLRGADAKTILDLIADNDLPVRFL